MAAGFFAMLADKANGDEEAAADKDGKNVEDTKNAEDTKFNYGIIIHCDIPEEAKQREMMDICQIACEKFAAAEKPPLERDNAAAAEMIKKTLDNKMNGPYNVIVGESYSMEIDFVQKTLLYMYFGGYLAILVWKCV